MRQPPPAGFRAKVVRAADRWRALDRDSAEPCRLAARVLRALGEDRELVWEYLTTPVALRPNEAGPWASLAEQMQRLAGVQARFGDLREQGLGGREVAGRGALDGVARDRLKLEV